MSVPPAPSSREAAKRASSSSAKFASAATSRTDPFTATIDCSGAKRTSFSPSEPSVYCNGKRMGIGYPSSTAYRAIPRRGISQRHGGECSKTTTLDVGGGVYVGAFGGAAERITYRQFYELTGPVDARNKDWNYPKFPMNFGINPTPRKAAFPKHSLAMLRDDRPRPRARRDAQDGDSFPADAPHFVYGANTRGSPWRPSRRR
ncbi:MAG: hypothetical protein M2R45_01494 [Verrucomicrobia subdivision 3 bacterium]|nr:hypothetical protein [Limisphaerales bacterium]MCS1413376.1 hypothetical protein [Limisphaerales bacterium]